MKLTKSTIRPLIFSLATASPAVLAGDSFYEAFSEGTVKFDSRLRYESVEQDGKRDNASGLTIRTRLGYETADFYTLKGYVEMLDNRIVGGVDEFAPVRPGSDYPVIGDPAITVLNQGYLQSTPIEGMNIRGGRQRIIIDNARFVGNVGWRQNEQTFDSFRYQYDVSGFEMDLAYIGRVKGVVPAFNAKVDDIIANVAYNTDVGKITAYYYGLNHSDRGNDIRFDMNTYGVRWNGKADLGNKWKLLYSAEYAQQSVSLWKGQKADLDASYLVGEFGFGWDDYSLLAGYEVLGSDDGNYGFQTPLATKHKFNGWADVFLVTPAQGLSDTYLKAVAKVAGFKFVAVYHQFNSTEGDINYGNEVDLLAAKSFGKRYTVGLKYANFSTSDLPDTYASRSKYWVWGEIKF
ncbi:Uncharacterised protein [BD1-7 clade bacterium]|uniref:Alginate export domain-containing protein n=1 Tax=BD1-7 clade bacterium TaxID=2029982 RepID=A0A5S9P7S9_9GAMM|nr:Uncharacterised protein [BD1-7 clade bacterium]CAA0099331.1 Uncharacterised protein [BD1-7 clade bacterium]